MKENELDGIFPVLTEIQKTALVKLFEANLDNPFESMHQVTEDAEYEIVEPIKIDNNKTE